MARKKQTGQTPNPRRVFFCGRTLKVRKNPAICFDSQTRAAVGSFRLQAVAAKLPRLSLPVFNRAVRGFEPRGGYGTFSFPMSLADLLNDLIEFREGFKPSQSIFQAPDAQSRAIPRREFAKHQTGEISILPGHKPEMIG